MKKRPSTLNFIIFSLALIFLVLVSVFNAEKKSLAYAQVTSYARIVSDDCVFYGDASGQTERFILPETYSLKVVSTGSDFTRVIYMDDSTEYPLAEGYVKTVNLAFSDEPPEIIYPHIRLQVKTSDVLFSDIGKTQPKAVLPEGATAIFYGTAVSGFEDYLYVYANGYVGYVRKSSFEKFTVPTVPEKEVQPEPQFDEETPSTTVYSDAPTKDKAEQVIVIVVFVVLTLLILVLILRPNGQKQVEDFSD